MSKNKQNLLSIALLLNGFTDEDVNARINSMKRIGEIADVLGAERSRNELVPFVTECCSDDEDELLLVFAEQMGRFSQLVGGLDFIGILLTPLDILCKVEENYVREKAVSSMLKLLDEVKAAKKQELIQKEYWPIVKNLGENRWYTARTSCVGLIGPIYPFLDSDSNKSTLRKLFWTLCKDAMPMVRRYCAKFLGDVAKAFGRDHIYPSKVSKGKKKKSSVGESEDCILGMYDRFRRDDQDSVRLLAVNCGLALLKLVDEKHVSDKILPTLKQLGKDRSWRVRYMVANGYSEFCGSVGEEVTSQELISLFANLCLDKEPEVRTASALQLSGVCNLLSKDQVISQILPTIRKLVNDKNPHVRSALASVIMGLSTTLGKDLTIKHLLEHFLALLKDSFPPVRLNIISKLSDVNRVIGTDMLSNSGLLPSICELAEDKQWRVRMSIIERIPILAKQLGKEYFNTKLKKLCIVWLSDSVFTIREAATKNIIELTQIFGEDWARKSIIPEALKMKDYSNYLYRMVVLFLVTGLSKVVSNDCVKSMVPTVVEMANDPVPNIKFNVAKCLGSILKKLDKNTISRSVKPALLSLQSSDDGDVKAFATGALKKL